MMQNTKNATYMHFSINAIFRSPKCNSTNTNLMQNSCNLDQGVQCSLNSKFQGSKGWVHQNEHKGNMCPPFRR